VVARVFKIVGSVILRQGSGRANVGGDCLYNMHIVTDFQDTI